MSQEAILYQTKQNLLKIISNSDYPENHPFLDDNFKNDYILTILALTKLFLNSKDTVEDFLQNKLKSHDKGIFSIEKFHQNLSEITFLWYLLSSLGINDQHDMIKSFQYEPNMNKDKKAEYSFTEPNTEKTINFEVKTVTCDPFLKETDKDFKIGNKYIKTYFGDDISKYISDTEVYIKLKHSSQYKQIRSALKKIAEKFKNKSDSLNIGVIVCQFATSYEEFLAYFMHSKKGYISKNATIFKDFDAVIFFSLTATPSITMDEIYQTENTFTIVTSDKINSETLNNFRLDNIFCNKGTINENLLPYTEEEYGKYILEERHKILSFYREDLLFEEKEKYCKEIAKKLYKQDNKTS